MPKRRDLSRRFCPHCEQSVCRRNYFYHKKEFYYDGSWNKKAKPIPVVLYSSYEDTSSDENMTGNSTEQLEAEFAPFLNPSARGDVKNIAIDYFLGMTGNEEGKQTIGGSQIFLEGIVSLTDDTDPVVYSKAYKILINLATETNLCGKIVKMYTFQQFISNSMKKMLDPEYDQADSICKFISNLTRTEACSETVSDCILSKKDIGVSKLVSVMCNVKYNPKANLDYVAPLLANLAQVPAVRKALMTDKEYIFQRCLPFLSYQESDIRRMGVASLVKNCCFDTAYHEWLLGDKVDLLPRLLLPLAGPEEFDDDDMEKLPVDLQYLPPDKTREPKADIRKITVESLFQLCGTKQGRQFVKENNTYVIMREYHKWEPDRMNYPAIMNLIDILIGEEPAQEHENLHQVEVPEHLVKKFHEDDEAEIKQIQDEINAE